MPDAGNTLVYDFLGSLWTAPVGTPLPTLAIFGGAAFTPATPWTNLGYVSEDGPEFATKDDVVGLRAWQSRAVVRNVSKGRETTLTFDLLEWSSANATFALGLDDDGTGLLTPSATAVESAVLVIVTDGDSRVGIGFPRAALTLDAKVAFKPADWAPLPIVLTALAPTTGPEFSLYLPTAA